MALPTKTVEIGFDLTSQGGPFFTLDDEVQGVLDNTEFTLGGTLFYDVTDYVISIASNRGKSRELDRYDAGNLEVIFDNTTRVFDPLNASSPYAGQIVPPREIRVKSNGDNQAVALASDGFTLLATQALAAHTAIPQLTGARINAVLNRPEVNWPLANRNIDVGTINLQGDVVDDGTGALTYLQIVEQTEGGSFFIDNSGNATFQDTLAGPSSSGLVVLSDDGTGQNFYTTELL
jgi:hypothetical protein